MTGVPSSLACLPGLKRGSPSRYVAIVLAVILSGCTTTKSEFALLTPAQIAAANPKWAPFPDYFRELTTRVNRHWDAILRTTPIHSEANSVTVSFTITSDGGLRGFEKVDYAGSKAQAEACANAIAQAFPLPAWTESMKAALGREQTLTFTFHYAP